jgi:hypothetical protein
MKTYVEFRVPESYAQEFLPADVGTNLMGFIRRVRVPFESAIYNQIGEIDKLVVNREQKHFFLGWNIQRIYSRMELESAELLLLKITKTFEPAGIECGTIYNNQNICKVCGAGIAQMSELVLDLKTVPKNVDIARTISNEIIFSQSLANLLHDNLATGLELKPVHHISATSSRKVWNQLKVNSLVNVDHATKTGNRPFDEDSANNYRCEYGHTIGLNILSELSIKRDSWDGSDIVATKELFGVNRGLLRTYPLLMISQRIYRLMIDAKCRGFTVEVVHLLS